MRNWRFERHWVEYDPAYQVIKVISCQICQNLQLSHLIWSWFSCCVKWLGLEICLGAESKATPKYCQEGVRHCCASQRGRLQPHWWEKELFAVFTSLSHSMHPHLVTLPVQCCIVVMHLWCILASCIAIPNWCTFALLIAGCILTQFQGAALSSLEQCAPTLTSERTIHKKWGEQSRAELIQLVPPFLTAGQQNDNEIVQNRSSPTIDNHRFCSHNQLNPTCKNRSPSVR